MFDMLDRLIVKLNYAWGLWAIGTVFEPMVTTKARVSPAHDADISPSSLEAMEANLHVITRGTRIWALVGVALVLVGPVSDLASNDAVTLVVLLLGAIGLIVWLISAVVVMARWRKLPEWGLSDRVALALKSRSLGDDAVSMIRSMPGDSLLLVAFAPLLKDYAPAQP